MERQKENMLCSCLQGYAFICPNISTWCPLFSPLEPSDVNFIYHTSGHSASIHLPRALEKADKHKEKKNRTKLKTSSTRILICAGSSASALASCRLLAGFTSEWEVGAAFNGLRCSDQIHQTAEVKKGEQHAGEMCLKAAFTGTFSSRASGICMCKSSGP